MIEIEILQVSNGGTHLAGAKIPVGVDNKGGIPGGTLHSPGMGSFVVLLLDHLHKAHNPDIGEPGDPLALFEILEKPLGPAAQVRHHHPEVRQ